MMDLRMIASALGGEISGRQLLCPGPGHSARDRSLSIKIEPNAPDGFIVFSHAGDDPIACKDYVRQRLGLPMWQPGDGRDRRIDPARVRAFDRSAIARESEKRPRTEDDIVRIERAVAIWNEAADPRDTVAAEYLRARCLDLGGDLAGSVLRFHPRTPWRNENTGKTDRIPCMIAAFRSIDDGTITAVHRIRLDQPERWPKTDRRMLGVVHRAAVMLDPPLGPKLAIGEGIETCMAARQLGVRPTWALGGAGAISFFPVLDGVKRLEILTENDRASRNATRLCISRWKKAWRKINVVTPDDGCSDLNDEIIMKARQHA